MTGLLTHLSSLQLTSCRQDTPEDHLDTAFQMTPRRTWKETIVCLGGLLGKIITSVSGLLGAGQVQAALAGALCLLAAFLTAVGRWPLWHLWLPAHHHMPSASAGSYKEWQLCQVGSIIVAFSDDDTTRHQIFNLSLLGLRHASVQARCSTACCYRQQQVAACAFLTKL